MSPEPAVSATPPTRIAHLADLASRVGETLGNSGWITIDQARIDRFAEATGDHQWIHVDRERAAQGPFKTTIAHGFLTLSLLPWMFEHGFEVDDVRMGVNYGLNRVRFPAPVPVDSRLRGHFKLLGYEPLEGGAQLLVEVTIEAEGGAKPVCVAESITRRYI
ncbi:MaoC family dehydratase [Ideonella azotifigens]|uniref:MaoC family dehydratase n=1 Tax=Ideonella azotifigens TaxID=513160 RepID=A0ABN1K1S9_9BURK|nr:MaoC family dehydratase [Ideonella azotifigens]MCD2341782.1 MaoC family dehydratase [Ideonella azotifigens]